MAVNKSKVEEYRLTFCWRWFWQFSVCRISVIGTESYLQANEDKDDQAKFPMRFHFSRIVDNVDFLDCCLKWAQFHTVIPYNVTVWHQRNAVTNYLLSILIDSCKFEQLSEILD